MVQNMEVVLKRFEQPDEVRTFAKGQFEVVRIGGMTIGRATYQPNSGSWSRIASRYGVSVRLLRAGSRRL